MGKYRICLTAWHRGGETSKADARLGSKRNRQCIVDDRADRVLRRVAAAIANDHCENVRHKNNDDKRGNDGGDDPAIETSVVHEHALLTVRTSKTLSGDREFTFAKLRESIENLQEGPSRDLAK
jgi:hypothetical protein